MDPITLIIIAGAVSRGVGKTLDATVMRLTRRLTRETCEGFTHLAGHKNALLRFAGQLAEQAVDATSDSQLQKRVYKLLASQSTELQALRDSLKDDAVWQFDVGQDLNIIQANLRKALTQISTVDKDVKKRIKQLPNVLFESLGMQHVSQRLDQIHGLMSRGLCEPLYAWEKYWDRMRGGVPWNELKSRPDAAYAVITSFVAREKEIDRFREFLAGEGLQILHVYGDMGTGKSRFLHECAAKAELDGWMVKFVNDHSQKIDLDAALGIVGDEIAEAKPAGLLLIWDDWQQGNDDALRYFLGPQANLNVPGHMPVKRIVSTWSIFRRNIKDHADHYARMESFELSPLDPGSPAVVSLLRELGLNEKDATELATKSDGHPMAMILGTDLLLSGEPLSKLTDKLAILHTSYNKWLKVLENRQPYAANTRAYVADLRQVALLGLLPSKDLHLLGNIADYPEPENAHERLERLAFDGFLKYDRDSESFAFPHDLFREHVVRLALMVEDVPLVHYRFRRFRNEEEAKSHLAAFANPVYLRGVYPLLAGLGDETRELRIWFARQSARWHEEHNTPLEIDRIFAGFCVNLTAAEPLPDVRLEIANLIEPVAARHKPPDREIDLQWAKALYNATVGEKNLRERKKIADKIGTVAARHDNDREIDLQWAKALYNITVVEKDPDKSKRIADEIGEIAKRHANDQEIDLEWAKALCSVTVVEKDPDKSKRIADEIGTVAKRHKPLDHDIDLWYGMGLFNARVVQREADARERIDASILEIVGRYPGDPDSKEILKRLADLHHRERNSGA